MAGVLNGSARRRHNPVSPCGRWTISNHSAIAHSKGECRVTEIYDWVPWFKELANKIAVGGEKYLAEKAKIVAWRADGTESPLLKYSDENIDPLSFFYTLASQSDGQASRARVYPSVVQAFQLDRTLNLDPDDLFMFPTPSRQNTLFHKGSGDPPLLWRLFRHAVQGVDAVQRDDFENALDIGNVGTRKLTQVLFLINPREFIPVDNHTKSLGLFESIPEKIGWEEYEQVIKTFKDAFPACQLYEANLFSYLQSKRKLHARTSTFFQASTNVYNDGENHWDDFQSTNSVYTGGPGKNRRYPLDQPKAGDIICVRFGQTTGFGIGIVYKNDYKDGFADNRRLHVVWLNKAQAQLSSRTAIIGFSSASGTMEIFRDAAEYASTFGLLDRLADCEPPEPLTKNGNARMIYPLNQIFYGPPGTGKTWRTTARALAIIDGVAENPEPDVKRFRELRDDRRVRMVTFHQNFAYEDFVEGIRPKLKSGGSLEYELRSGIFKEIVAAAEENANDRFVLIIDEINRGNIAKIFGELITLIEDSRRKGKADETCVTLPYSGETFTVPDNIFIIGTMNTADRSIQLLDTALRRRFDFIEMMPDTQHKKIERNIDGVDCGTMLAVMNERIKALLDREHQIGHTYLFGVATMDQLAEAFRNRMFPMLQEYFFDDWAKIRAVLGGNDFVRKKPVQPLLPESELLDEDQVIYERSPDEDPAWRDPNEYRRIYGSEATPGRGDN